MFSCSRFFPLGLIILSIAITPDLVRCIEMEEVSRVQENERHSKLVFTTICRNKLSIVVHHIQHHMQPLIARKELPEEHPNHVSMY